MKLTLKGILEKHFKVDLPISGGFGDSIDNAIIIHRNETNDYVGTEHLILKCVGIAKRRDWKILGQELLVQDGKTIDKIKFEAKESIEGKIITEIKNYYFDITECYGIKKEPKKPFDEEKVLAQIEERIKVLEGLNDFNKKCVEMLRTGELFEDGKPTIEFLDVIFEDESFPLFNSIWVKKGRPILDVLRIIGKRI